MRAAQLAFLVSYAGLYLLGGCATECQRGETTGLPVRVFRTKGDARWRSAADQPWQEVKVGTMLPPGAVIETANQGWIDVCLGKAPKRIRSVLRQHGSGRVIGHETLYDDMIRLYPGTRIRLDRLALGRSETGVPPARDVAVDLSAGEMSGLVPRLAEGSRYEIQFPAGVVRVRGSTFHLSVDGLIRVIEGSVSVTYGGSVTPQLVMSNQQFDVRTGEVHPIPNW